MNNQHYTVSLLVDQTPQEAFQAINNVNGWWTENVVGSSKKLNDEFEYRMPDIHYSRQKVVELIPDERIVWLVTDSNLSSFKDKKEWNGTKIIFEIKEINGKSDSYRTQMRFTHIGLTPKFQCYGDCSGAWEMLVQHSLHRLITTGKGKKVF